MLQLYNDVCVLPDQDLIQENANVDGKSPLGKLARLSSEVSKQLSTTYLLSERSRLAIRDNYLYVHDADYYVTGSTTCCQIPLGELLANGFHTGHGTIRPPQDIRSALALASIILQANQNMQHGGQAFPMFDVDLAPYVEKTYERQLERLNGLPIELTVEQKQQIAEAETVSATYQACEAFIHNANSMHSRGGGQVPFVSINYGTDTSRWGRVFIRELLKATERGLGNGETPIFPIQIFKVKEGVNFNDGDPNVDLFRHACRVTGKRLFPNFSFVDAPFNLQYYDGTHASEVAYMGCRTRVMGNRHGAETSIGRGNLSFSTLNLVKMALVSSDIESFYKTLDGFVDIAIEQLLERFDYQCKRHADEFRFLYAQHVWRGSETLLPESELRDVLKQGTLSLGFIGLAEALRVLVGGTHVESREAERLGLDIVTHLANRMRQAADDHDLNFSLLATPAEGLSGKFVLNDQHDFGMIAGVTDRAFYTNSFHVPVYQHVSIRDKVRIEAPYHALCDAGHITYVEVDGSLAHNPEAVESIVRLMRAHDVGYGSINHPVDRCGSCGLEGIIDESCPTCGERDQIERIRRITGYLVGTMDRWNSAKREEERARVKHHARPIRT
ncbi:anaerobic ribonucleoside triphosphate reductase [Exiguobacterium sp. SH3S2]|uniref:anaerobic ribonucleoside triphosphate reductase n=1 Tax=unclassified Exiguobacterium TaxID=2644629 RepID=UPI00103A0478|nr:MULTISPECIES: anaerobic ribonucleoside triphosphate reductase [unclassified Exiguobacterium]TCI24988.1 anaerobic ribonucleoside triphosphate reductase [Exiguobacterium sp. SH5S4]TCI45640.1 anaerobic ribonucleoside triphosphate reductase [Exiguobacterium sp. SH3S3]TCI60849.1 anaerobic ribonucleoside triphosphate reductase [Exiguobacterium sp. SH3S2]TCI65973.1 anaerobic ribonucleoside triphosphate reductase [Exiguobacterium sp. SH3S1]